MQKSSPKWGDMPKEEEKKQGAGNVPSEKNYLVETRIEKVH